MLRWFIAPDGEPWPDWTGRARVADRCVYTGLDADSVRAASDGNRFSRTLKRNVDMPGTGVLVERARDLGVTAWTQRLGLANRAGAAAVGQIAAREACRENEWTMVLATDAGEAAMNRFSQNAHRKNRPMIRAEGAFIGSALGREFVSVVVVTRSPFAESLAAWAAALGTYPESPIRSEAGGDPTVDRGQQSANIV